MSHLRLVSAAPATLPGPAPTVLTPRALGQIAALNVAVRRLRAWGIPIVGQRADTTPPQVVIERGRHVSIRPLLDAAGPRSYLTGRGGVHVSCMLLGVLVRWTEGQP